MTNSIKKRPILFSTPMVRAILDGRKTVTRGIAKLNQSCRVFAKGRNWHCEDPEAVLACPYGRPGDLLWVRETWRIGAWDENCGSFCIDYCDGPSKVWRTVVSDDDGGDKFNDLWIACSDELAAKGVEPDEAGQYHWPPGESPLRWRPSIHMPRWASRITLHITGVRIERLQDISGPDCVAEGIVRRSRLSDGVLLGRGDLWKEQKREFRALWESINSAGSWDANPYVWVVEFEKI
jgi:hypothetical protein